MSAVGCYLVLLSRETVSSDNGGLELPAVIFRDKSSGRRTIGNGPTALIYLTIVSTLRLSLKFREKESFHVVAESAPGNARSLAARCMLNLAVQSSEQFVVVSSCVYNKIETALLLFVSSNLTELHNFVN